MILKKHYLKIWIRIIAIVLTCMGIAFVSIPQPDWFFVVNLTILLFIQVLLFVRSQNILNRELAYLFDSVESSETTITFTKKSKSNEFLNLYEKFDDLIKNIQRLKIDSIQKNVFLETLFEHINIGIITVDRDGKISLKNSSARKVLGKGNINTIEDIHKLDSSLANSFEKINPEESKLISFYRDGFLQHLSIRATLLKFPDENIKIISFQNIIKELDAREMEGWQKLIRVLTHELMNSVGPINSTISTVLELLENRNSQPNNLEEISSERIQDAIKGIKIIKDRSKSMLGFVKRFRSLTLIPHPESSNININNLVNDVFILMKDEAILNDIELENKIRNKNLIAWVDRGMIEQILINLLKNCFEAIKDVKKPKVSVSAWEDQNSIYVTVEDNGKGIPVDIQDKIFVPFYTTYKNGTGIGLSLSRQLANSLGGALILTKSGKEGTCFTLKVKSI